MGCISSFLQGYKQTARQECKLRATAPRGSINPSQEEYWKQRDDYEAVPSVSFSFGNDDDGGVPAEPVEKQSSVDMNGHNGFPKSVGANPHDNGFYNNQQGIATFGGNDSSNSEKSISNSSQSYSQSRSKLGEGSRPMTGEQSASIPNSASGAQNDGDIEWMYQLNALEKEHAQRNRGEMRRARARELREAREAKEPSSQEE